MAELVSTAVDYSDKRQRLDNILHKGKFNVLNLCIYGGVFLADDTFSIHISLFSIS